MLYESRVKLMGYAPTFPNFTGERVYMQAFSPDERLPNELSRWQDLVDVMMDGVDTHEECYLMIDQQFVKADSYHRRGGLHIDGYWHANGGRHRGDEDPSIGRWKPTPTHLPRRKGGIHGSRHTAGAIVGWGDSAFEEPEGIILATNIEATRAICGTYAGPIGDGGDCSDIRIDDGYEEMWLEAGNVYAGNVTMLHQTHPVPVDCYRTVVRINAPGWTI